MIGRYTKKPVTIEAVRVTASNLEDIVRWTQGRAVVVSLVGEAALEVATLEGTMYATVGSWVVKGVKGEFYPVANDIFEATYEGASDDKEKK